MMGVVLGNEKNLIELQRWNKNSGNYVSPDDIYMALRGLRTLPLRLRKSSENSVKIAKFLEYLVNLDIFEHVCEIPTKFHLDFAEK